MATENLQTSVTISLTDDASGSIARIREEYQRLIDALKKGGGDSRQDQEEREKHAEKTKETFEKAKTASEGFRRNLRPVLMEAGRNIVENTTQSKELGRAFETVAQSASNFGFSLTGLLGRAAGGIGLMVAVGAATFSAAQNADKAFKRAQAYRRELGEAGAHQINILRKVGEEQGRSADEVDSQTERMIKSLDDLKRHSQESDLWNFLAVTPEGEQLAEKYYRMLQEGSSRVEVYIQLRKDLSKQNEAFQRRFGNSFGLNLAEVQDFVIEYERIAKLRDKPEIYAAEEKLLQAQKEMSEALKQFNEVWEKTMPKRTVIMVEALKAITEAMGGMKDFIEFLFMTPSEGANKIWEKLKEHYVGPGKSGGPTSEDVLKRLQEHQQQQGYSPISFTELDRKEGEGNVFLRQMRDIVVWMQNEGRAPGTGGITPVAFHNQPAGGAASESNPILLPPNTGQLGGGARAEARQPLIREWRPGDPVISTYKRKGRDQPFPILAENLTALPPRPGYDPQGGKASDPFTGVTTGKGIATWFGNMPSAGWTDPGPSGDPMNSNLLRVPEASQGISLSSPQTVGEFRYVTDPATGLTHVLQQTEAGPNVRTQKLIDVSVAKALQMGYTKKTFEAAHKAGVSGPWTVRDTGFGTRGRALVGDYKDPRQRIEPIPGGEPWTKGGTFEEEGYKGTKIAGLDPDYAGPGPEEGQGKGLRLDLGGGSFGGGGATSSVPERAAVDRPLPDESAATPEARTQVNLNFNNAPSDMRAETRSADDGLDVQISRSTQLPLTD